jgi:hypothetical protein
MAARSGLGPRFGHGHDLEPAAGWDDISTGDAPLATPPGYVDPFADDEETKDLDTEERENGDRERTHP